MRVNKGMLQATLGVVLVLVMVLGVLSTYRVNEDEYAYEYKFGKVDSIEETPGLKFKVPLVIKVKKLPKNYQFYDIKPSEVLTKDKKTMIVDSYIVWRIADPLQYIRNLRDIESAGYKLDNIVYNALKNNLSNVDQEVAITRDMKLTDAIQEDVASSLKTYGMEVVDIQIKQLDLPEENKVAVYNRMISERNKMVATYTAEGKEEAEKIKNITDKEVAIILAEAEAESAKLIAEGESEYMSILADAYSTEDRKQFYEFIRSLDALRVTMQGEKTLFLPVDSELGRLFLGK